MHEEFIPYTQCSVACPCSFTCAKWGSEAAQGKLSLLQLVRSWSLECLWVVAGKASSGSPTASFPGLACISGRGSKWDVLQNKVPRSIGPWFRQSNEVTSQWSNSRPVAELGIETRIPNLQITVVPSPLTSVFLFVIKASVAFLPALAR